MGDFKTGQVVWVPSLFINIELESSYWPAKFVQTTNIKTLCMVNIYPSKIVPAQENFLVQSEGILPFSAYQPDDHDEQLVIAYEKAKADSKRGQFVPLESVEKPTIPQNSVSICQKLECMYIQHATKKKVDMEGIADLMLPLEEDDIRNYFYRRTPQLLCYLIDLLDFKGRAEVRDILMEWNKKITGTIMKMITEGKFPLTGQN